MNQFEKVTKSVKTMAEFLATKKFGDHKGCAECDFREGCKGEETCKKGWEDFLNSEV